MFLRNGCYVAAWDHELGERLLPRTLLNQNIVLFRGANSEAALEDRCCHRHAPLSAGKRAIAAFPNAPSIDVSADMPTIQARNLLARLIEDERAR